MKKNDPQRFNVEELRTLSGDAAFKAYAFAHEQWMMRTVAGPLIAAALRLIATGAVDLDTLAEDGVDLQSPWLLERHGFLLAPEADLVEAR